MKITVIGTGYVGATLTVMLAKHHDVFVFDRNPEMAIALQNGTATIDDECMRARLKDDLSINAISKYGDIPGDTKFIFIATPTDLDPGTETLDTSSIEEVIGEIEAAYDQKEHAEKLPAIVIKSTVPTDFTRRLQDEHPGFTIIYCPEFLREKTAMADVLAPSRIVLGCDSEDALMDNGAAKVLSEVLLECSERRDVPVLFTSTSEAAAIKLFSNSYLAMRLAFFNELDTFAVKNGLDTDRVIKGVSLDPRIGDWYNVPGPGFGGKCLPKDATELASEFGDDDGVLIKAMLESNELRKKHSNDD